MFGRTGRGRTPGRVFALPGSEGSSPAWRPPSLSADTSLAPPSTPASPATTPRRTPAARTQAGLHLEVGDLQIVVGAPLVEFQLQLLAERVGGRRPQAAAQAGGAAQQASEEAQVVQGGGARGLRQARGRVGVQLPREVGGTPGAAAQAEGAQGGPRAQRSLHAQYHPGPVPARVGRSPL